LRFYSLARKFGNGGGQGGLLECVASGVDLDVVSVGLLLDLRSQDLLELPVAVLEVASLSNSCSTISLVGFASTISQIFLDDDEDDRGNHDNKNYGANPDVHTFLCYGRSHNSLVALRYSLFHQMAMNK